MANIDPIHIWVEEASHITPEMINKLKTKAKQGTWRVAGVARKATTFKDILWCWWLMHDDNFKADVILAASVEGYETTEDDIINYLQNNF